MIKVSINNICAKLTECEPLTSGMIGNLVEVSFSAEWSGLNKIAVFSNGDVTKDLLESQWNGNYIPIPQEVLATPHRTISMGIYGYELVDDEKVLAIPTIVTEIGKTKFGADPSDDPAADPTLPIWAQIQTEVDDLDDRVTYLEEHGGGGGGIPEAPIDGKQYARKDGAWTEVQSGGSADLNGVVACLNDIKTLLTHTAYVNYDEQPMLAQLAQHIDALTPQPEDPDIEQDGSTLIIRGGYTATQDGSTLKLQ